MSDEAVLCCGDAEEDWGEAGVECPSGSGGTAHVGDVRAREAGAAAGRRPEPKRPNGGPYSVAFRLRAVKLHLEEGFPADQVCRETGVSAETLRSWLERYRAGGEPALVPRSTSPNAAKGREQIAPAVKAEMIAQKQRNPGLGVKRISQFLRRMLHLPGSAETVRRTLHQAGLLEPSAPRRPKTPPKPRFFERATPNQMWQSDIYTFHLAGKNAYLIGYMDDYSRFLVGLDLYRSQTAENVLELYRRATGEYGVPREMLTDNGRQYASWRGLTRFQQELAKDKVHHLRSRPHHPMTLGKIERFWKSIWEEFLCRAQFDSFDSARERVRLWLQYYNHRRPHQGIGGVCPADRFFEIRGDLRRVMEQGIEENVKELALRGRAPRPFYLVGRLDKQSVVMRAEKGKLVMTVNDEDSAKSEEVVCNLNEGKVDYDGTRKEGQAECAAVHGGGQVPGSAGAVDGTAVADGTEPGTGRVVERAQPVAADGDGGPVAGAGAEGQTAERAGAAVDAAAEPAGAPPGSGRADPAGVGKDAAGEEHGTVGSAAAEFAEGTIDAALVARVLRLLADGGLDRYVIPPPAGRAAGAPAAGSAPSATE